MSAQMLRYHLDPTVDVSSRRPEAIDAAIAWTSERFSLGAGSSILDLGCGPGLYTSRWAATGAEVTGVDFSPRSIDYARAVARRNGLPIRYIEADYLAWQPDRTFDLVTMIMCDFSALGPTQRSHLLRSVRAWLAPRGAFLFDVHALPFLASRQEDVRRNKHPQGGFWSAAAHAEVVETLVYPAERVSLDRYEITEPSRTWTVWNWLQAYDPLSLTRLLEEHGFAVDTILEDVAGADYDATADEFAVIALASDSVRRRRHRRAAFQPAMTREAHADP